MSFLVCTYFNILLQNRTHFSLTFWVTDLSKYIFFVKDVDHESKFPFNNLRIQLKGFFKNCIEEEYNALKKSIDQPSHSEKEQIILKRIYRRIARTICRSSYKANKQLAQSIFKSLFNFDYSD